MSVEISSQDRTRSVGAKFTTTSATTIYTATGFGAKGVNISLCDVNAGASVDVSVAWYDASENTTYNLMSTYTINAKQFYLEDIGGLWLDAGDEIRITASVANSLHAVLTVIETHGGR